MRPVASISAYVASFLDFCRIEKGLARATLEAYRLDLERFTSKLSAVDNLEDPAVLRRYIDSLYTARMSSRSIARHLTTLRNLYKFLMEQGIVDTDPTALLSAPKQWQSLPKYLNKQQLTDLIAAPDRSRPQGMRDSAVSAFLTWSKTWALCAWSGREISIALCRSERPPSWRWTHILEAAGRCCSKAGRVHTYSSPIAEAR
jgi:site-specific recombinase XerC